MDLWVAVGGRRRGSFKFGYWPLGLASLVPRVLSQLSIGERLFVGKERPL